MRTSLVPIALALVCGVRPAQAQSNSLFISGNVMTGQTWHAAQDPGNGSSGSCSTTSGIVQYYQASFFTDQTADTYSLSLYYESFQSGFVYLYRDQFAPGDPCEGIFVFGHAPLANIHDIHLDANRQYVFVTSEDVLFGGGGSFQVTIAGPAGSHLFLGAAPNPNVVPFCFGDGTSAACPCGNSGSLGHGCENSASTGGSQLSATGQAVLASDSLELSVSGERSSALSIFTQGDTPISPSVFGDGLRCAGGNLKRLYVHNAVGGAVSAPEPGEPSVSARSAALGDPIPSGGIRFYFTYYRDSSSTFCPTPPGDTFNSSNELRITWN